MKKGITIVSLILLFASCAIIQFFNPFPSGIIETGGIAFDLDNNKQININNDPDNKNGDLILEPFYKDGEPAPAMQLLNWGDANSFIMDLGEISLDRAIKLSDEELTPDSIIWEIYIIKNHVYFVISSEFRKYFVLVDSVNIIAEIQDDYAAKAFFHYTERK